MNRHTQQRSRRTAPRAFTLLEMVVVIIIIGVLAALIGPRIFGRIGQSKSAVAMANAKTLATALKLYQADYGSLPDSGNLAVLAARPTSANSKGPYLDNAESLIDPWGHPFILRVPGEKNVDFDVISRGADGNTGGEGEDADIIAP